MIADKLRAAIRDIPDFPKEGILFKDITPVLLNPDLCNELIAFFAEKYTHSKIDAICGIESRGFLFGMGLAQKMNLPFIPVRKAGKLPADVVSHTYNLEYGTATIEIHKDAIKPGMRVLVHDDLLATGGTAVAAAELVRQLGGEVEAFAFLIDLTFLKGKERLKKYTDSVYSVLEY